MAKQKLPTRITVAYLKKMEACTSKIDLFRRTFGNSAEINLENLRKAKAAGLNLGYLYKYLYEDDRLRTHKAYCPRCGASIEKFYRKYRRDLKAQEVQNG